MGQVKPPPSKRQAFKAKIKKWPDLPQILTEGDSWFAFPLPSRRNVIDQLIPNSNAAWLRLESNGHEIRDIMSGKQLDVLRDRLEEFPTIQLIMMSGGGNDILGDRLPQLLKLKRDEMEWNDCINDAQVDTRLSQIEKAYRRLVSLRDRLVPECHILTHLYDYATPKNKGIRLGPFKLAGPWIYPAMLEKRIVDPEDQQKIIRELLSRFSKMMKALAKEHPKYIVVDTTDTLGQNEWGDEIHPTNNGFRKVTRKFIPELRKLFPAGGFRDI